MRAALIVLGDTTDHGGEVISAAPAATVSGKPVARLGDLVSCPRCGGDFPIVQGNLAMNFDGAAAAYEGCAVACGATLIASHAGMTTLPGTGDEGTTPRRYFSFEEGCGSAQVRHGGTPPTSAPRQKEEISALPEQATPLLEPGSPNRHIVHYDMTRSPPAPVTGNILPTPGWLARNRDPVAGANARSVQGRIRRLETVMIHDPTRRPTQDNIRHIIDMPAAPDSLSDRRLAAHEKIAGDAGKLLTASFSDGVPGNVVLAVRGTLYFQGSHTAPVREAICQCFDLYATCARDHLTWLWREEAPAGPAKVPYAKASSMRALLARMDANDHVGFAYTGARADHEASPWLFRVSGLRAWEARMGDNGLDTLQFSLPANEVLRSPARFQALFVACARLLAAQHGHGGYAVNLPLAYTVADVAAEAAMIAKHAGIDAGNAILIASRHRIGIVDHIKTVGWLTAINTHMVARVGGLPALRSALPRDWFAKYDYGSGIVIQAGPAPATAPVDGEPKPARYVLPNSLLAPLRVPQLGSLHGGASAALAEQWLRRFDIPNAALLQYKAALLNEPKLTASSTLPDVL